MKTLTNLTNSINKLTERNRKFSKKIVLYGGESVEKKLYETYNNLAENITKARNFLIEILNGLGNLIWATLKLLVYYAPAVLIFIFFRSNIYLFLFGVIWFAFISYVGSRSNVD